MQNFSQFEKEEQNTVINAAVIEHADEVSRVWEQQKQRVFIKTFLESWSWWGGGPRRLPTQPAQLLGGTGAALETFFRYRREWLTGPPLFFPLQKSCALVPFLSCPSVMLGVAGMTGR